MAKRGIQRSGRLTQAKMLHSALTLFLLNGYEKTTVAQISKGVGMTTSAFFRAYQDKEAVLLSLTEHMFARQFEEAENLLGNDFDPVLLYGIETAAQLHIAELSEPLQNLYVAAYSLPTTSEYIYQHTAAKLKAIFAKYMPAATEKDFYELEIASGSITRGYMAKKCSIYFPMERKVEIYLSCCLTLYQVPEKKRREIIDTVLKMDLKAMAKKMVKDIAAKVETDIEAEEQAILQE